MLQGQITMQNIIYFSRVYLLGRVFYCALNSQFNLENTIFANQVYLSRTWRIKRYFLLQITIYNNW